MLNFIEHLHSEALIERARLKPNAFSRTRVLTFPVLLVAMLSGFKASSLKLVHRGSP